jgi:hypothetical protein
MLNYLHFKTLYSMRQNLNAVFLINVSKSKKFTVVPLWILLVSMYLLSKVEIFPHLMLVMSHDLVLRQGASQLRTASADLWGFSKYNTSLEHAFSCSLSY